MAAVTICSDSEAREHKICYCFEFFSYYLPWSDGTRCHDFSCFNGEFQASFFTSSFTLIKKFFSSSSLSALWVVLSAYLRLLIFLPEILIPAYHSPSPAFCMMYFACKLNKQGNNIQSSPTPFPILSKSVVLCLGLTVASWSAHRFLRRHVRWPGTPNSLRIFIVCYDPKQVKGFCIVNEAEVDVFLKLPCFLHDPTSVDNLISVSSASSKPTS